MAATDAAFLPGSFADRMMRKMGWSEGKGLGKAENGIASSVKVKRRVEGEGLGVTNDQSGASGWSATADAFGSALSALAEKYGDDAPAQATKSRAPPVARARVLRSKDTSLYSADDMRAILGGAADTKKRRPSDEPTKNKKAKKRANDAPKKKKARKVASGP